MEIKINIDDERFFGEVAQVVDREEFLEEMTRIRRILGMTTPLNRDEYLKFVREIWGSPKAELLDKEIERSRKRLYLHPVFKGVIKKATLCGQVDSGDYSPAYLDHKLETFRDDGTGIDEVYSIILSPGVRDKDVLSALWKYRETVEQGLAPYGYNIPPIWKIDKKKPSIKKYREWYLSNISGDSPALIAEKETMSCVLPEGHKTDKEKPKGCVCYDESTIRKGIAAYQNLIRKTPTL